jgi:hypothetical protein
LNSQTNFECALGYHTIGIYAYRNSNCGICFLVERCICCGKVIEAASFGFKISLQEFVDVLDDGIRIRQYIEQGYHTLKQMGYALSSHNAPGPFQNVEDSEFVRLDVKN